MQTFQLTLITLQAVDLSQLIITCRLPDWEVSQIATAGAVLSLCSTFSIALILYLTHRRSDRPSSLLSVYLSVTILLNAARSRSFILREDRRRGALEITAGSLKLLLVVLEELPLKHYTPKAPDRARGWISERIAGFWARSLFVWINKTLLTGFANVIDVKCLPELDFSSESLSASFQSYWIEGQPPLRRLLTWFINMLQPEKHHRTVLLSLSFVRWRGRSSALSFRVCASLLSSSLNHF